MTRPFISKSHSTAWPMLLVAALLLTSVHDLRHEHADGPGAPACYTCHFSVDLGALPNAGALPDRPSEAARPPVHDAKAAHAAVPGAYDARGPPLLS